MGKTVEYESLKEKLKKLQVLAERGYQGEADNARRLFERLCEQYGVSIEELMDEQKKKQYRFVIGRNKVYIELFVQCYAKVTGNRSLRYGRVSRNEIAVELTAIQYAELASLFEWHKSNFDRDLEDMKKTIMQAYISKHHLTSGKSDGESRPLTAEDIIELRKIIAMREALNDNYFHKMISNK